MVIKNTFNLGDEVYLKTDTDQKKRLIVGLSININGSILYRLVCGTEDDYHYEQEISETKDVVMTTSN